jgi:SAM-dependent methyltransferase
VAHMAVTKSRFSSATGCPACRGLTVHNEGALPRLAPNIFGGRRVNAVLKPGCLLHCIECDLRFRFPYVSQATLNKLYEKLPSTVWECTEPRSYWPQILKLMARYSPNQTVLDVGCFRGDFLTWLPPHWEKMGIEPNEAASQIARARGLRVLGAAVEEIHPLPKPAGVITLLDVLEHVVDPFSILRRLTQCLADSGCIIIITGATDTLAWRMFGRDYWYSSLPEHVSFFTQRWFRWAADRLGLSPSWVCYLPSEPGPLSRSMQSFLRQSGYAVVSRMRSFSVPESLIARLPGIKRAAKWPSPPWWREAKDHILIVLTKQ